MFVLPLWRALFTFYCCAKGSPFKLEPMTDDAGLFHSLSASNQEALDSRDVAAKNARQLVEKTFRFTANDCRGNHAGQIR